MKFLEHILLAKNFFKVLIFILKGPKRQGIISMTM